VLLTLLLTELPIGPDLSGAVVVGAGRLCAVGKEQAVWLWEKDYKAHVTENLAGVMLRLWQWGD